jgi:glycerol-3-phosphate O-acyltransferase/dihydroxyacetone phosphate acyltransferase
MNALYTGMRGLIGLAVGAYFHRVERFHAERVPPTGPVLFVSNHPSSLNDSFVIGTSVGRKVNFVGTVQLFRFAPLKWLLQHCGVIPINRLQDNPKAMRSVTDTFEAVFRVLERGEAVAIFPEGITHDDPQLKEVKSGAARIALELEQRHGGKLGLQIVPVGLTFSAKEIYRSEALVNFGEPIRVAGFLAGYEAERKECIRRLTHEIETRIQNLILHLPHLEHARVVEAVKHLYLDQLRIGNRVIHEPVSRQAGDLLLTQAIAKAVEIAFAEYPERAAAFVTKLDFYERWLKRLKVSDDALAEFPDKKKLLHRSLLRSLLAILAAPVAAYGWVHRFIPVRLVRYGVTLTAPDRRKAQTPPAKMIGGLAAFVPCYLVYAVIFHQFFGWPASLWYGLSLPPSGWIAYYYIRNLRRLGAALRNTAILLRSPLAAKQLLALRSALIAEIESLRPEIQSHFPPAPDS